MKKYRCFVSFALASCIGVSSLASASMNSSRETLRLLVEVEDAMLDHQIAAVDAKSQTALLIHEATAGCRTPCGWEMTTTILSSLSATDNEISRPLMFFALETLRPTLPNQLSHIDFLPPGNDDAGPSPARKEFAAESRLIVYELE